MPTASVLLLERAAMGSMASLSACTADLCVSWGSRVSGQDHLMVKAREPLSFIADLITIECGIRSWAKPLSWLRSRAQLSLVVFLNNILAWKPICQIYFCIFIHHTTATKKSPRQVHMPITSPVALCNLTYTFLFLFLYLTLYPHVHFCIYMTGRTCIWERTCTLFFFWDCMTSINIIHSKSIHHLFWKMCDFNFH